MMIVFLAGALAFSAPAKQTEREAPAAKTPAVTAVKGNVLLETARDEGLHPARVGVRLVERAELKTPEGGELRLDLDPTHRLRLGGSTRVTLPGIRWEGGEVPIVILSNGTVRWIATGEGPRLQTPVFDLTPGKGDFVFSYDAKTARAEVWVIDGEIALSATNAENAVKVPAHHKAWFQGVVEDGEVAADLLLKGRKIPRGKLSKAVALSADELKPYLEEEKIRVAEAKKVEEKLRAQKSTDLKEGVVCLKPRGRFNHCAWVCEGNPADSTKCRLDLGGVHCVRRRCNANGAWAEPKTLDLEDAKGTCKVAPVVAACDY